MVEVFFTIIHPCERGEEAMNNARMQRIGTGYVSGEHMVSLQLRSTLRRLSLTKICWWGTNAGLGSIAKHRSSRCREMSP